MDGRQDAFAQVHRRKKLYRFRTNRLAKDDKIGPHTGVQDVDHLGHRRELALWWNRHDRARRVWMVDLEFAERLDYREHRGRLYIPGQSIEQRCLAAGELAANEDRCRIAIDGPGQEACCIRKPRRKIFGDLIAITATIAV